jgi:hypothetical protein
MFLMDQMILPKPSIIIIWTYQDMMDWMSRILVGEMGDADEDFGDQMILPKPSIIIIWTYQDMMDWISRMQDIGWRNG